MSAKPTDLLRRPITDLRVSVIDRCNFRCRYCMPRHVYGPEHEFLERAEILTAAELARLTRIFVDLGARKVRLTGGEPLLRADLADIVRRFREIPGIDDLALTTNGSRLARVATELAAAGLDRVTVSLDSLEDSVFRELGDTASSPASVLAGIAAARDAGLDPVKVNMVVIRGVNDHGVVDMAREFKGSGVVVRFIEYMDVGSTNGWNHADVVAAEEMVETINNVFPVAALPRNSPNDPAMRFAYADGDGEFGVVASVTKPFCGACTRARLSADGQLFTCLFGTTGHDLREPLRSGADDEALAARVRAVWERRDDRYSELRGLEDAGAAARAEMSYIGG